MKNKITPSRNEETELRWIEATLSNDENSSDQDLIEYFISNGLSEESARSWVLKRNSYLNEPLNLSSSGGEHSQKK